MRQLIVLDTCSVKEVMLNIDASGYGFCFVVDKQKKMIGLITDGDLRRFLLKHKNIELSIINCINKNFIFGLVTEKYDELIKKLTDKIKVLPILSEDGNVVNFITNQQKNFIPILEPTLGKQENINVQDCMNSGWISSNGKYVKLFEENFSILHENRQAVAVSNGTVALHLALVALGVGPGDEVIVPSLTFAACAATIVQSGATPVFCECDNNLCIDPLEVEKLVTSRTKAILIVHLYGRMADVVSLQNIAQRHNLLLIEDAAEALGSSLRGQHSGTFGDAATFSFFGNKTITTGEGGMVLFKDNKHAEIARTLRDHGMSKAKRYWHDVVGFNYRMTNIQAAIGVAQLEKLDDIISKKRAVMSKYVKYFHGKKFIKYYSTDRNEEINSNWLFNIIFSFELDIDELIVHLNGKQIDTRRIFYPLHLMPPYSQFRRSNKMKKTCNASNQGICLPSSSNLSSKDLDRVISEIDIFLRKKFNA